MSTDLVSFSFDLMKKKSHIPEGLSVHGSLLGHYYHDFRYELSMPRKMDCNGIPLWDYGDPIGQRYHPVLITAYSLALHEKYLYDCDDESRTRFLQLADYLVEMQKQSRTGFGWEYDVPSYKYHTESRWVSAMAQGLGISALLRAYQIDPREVYLNSASKALDAFDLPCKDGGVREVDEAGHVFFEEVPSTSPAGSTHILNGFFFALWGIHDYVRVTGEARAQRFLGEGIDTLRETIASYDTGYWTLYCLGWRNYLTDRFYHQLHIDGAAVFHLITGEPLFQRFAERWAAYQNNPWCLVRWWAGYRFFRVVNKATRIATLLKLA